MRQLAIAAAAVALGLAGISAARAFDSRSGTRSAYAQRDDRRDRDDDRRDRDADRRDREDDRDRYGDPDLKKKLVPILTVGSSLNVGIAQVAGEEGDVDRVKAVAQLETDYKDVARIKILVPVQSQNVVQHIDRVPGVSVTAYADYAIKK